MPSRLSKTTPSFCGYGNGPPFWIRLYVVVASAGRAGSVVWENPERFPHAFWAATAGEAGEAVTASAAGTPQKNADSVGRGAKKNATQRDRELGIFRTETDRMVVRRRAGGTPPR